MSELELPGVLTADELRRTGEFIAAHQDDSGAIPWWRGGQLDPWDHVEAAMGLDVLGRHEEAVAAYRWMAATQDGDGSWPMLQTDGVISDAASDTNQCAYIATGLWHHHLITGDRALLEEMWPTLEAALGFVCGHQLEDGPIAWAVGPDRRPDSFGLLTGSASIVHALASGLQIAAELGRQRPAWKKAGDRLSEAVSRRPGAFADRRRYSMDWYYPVLGGAVRGEAAWELLQGRWEDFVWPGYGARCVDDRPWVTAAESAELVLALDAIGRDAEARAILTDLQHTRDAGTGGYWTGYVVPDETFWPVEQTTWTAAAVVLAVDAVTRTTGGSGIFRDLPWNIGVHR